MTTKLQRPHGALAYTIGIELEFMYADDQRVEDHDDITTGPWELIISALESHGVKCKTDFGHHADTPNYSTWTIGDDGSVHLDEAVEDYTPLLPGPTPWGLELRSPKWSVWDDDWAGEIRKVMRILDSTCNTPSSRLLLNERCGFHVHLGVSGRPHSFRTIKNLLQLTTGFQRIIDELHTATRLSETNKYCVPPSRHFLKLVPIHPDMHEFFRAKDAVEDHPLAWCRFIESSVHSPQQLEKGRWTNHGNAYNYENLFSCETRRDKAPLGTIEFRQHAGTLDEEEIVAWMNVVVAMVHFCHVVGASSLLMNLLTRQIENPTFGACELLNAIGTHSRVVQYYGFKLGADTARQELMEIMESDIPENFVPLVQNLEEARYMVRCREAVMGTIAGKLSCGFYGSMLGQGLGSRYAQFDEIEPDEVDVSDGISFQIVEAHAVAALHGQSVEEVSRSLLRTY